MPTVEQRSSMNDLLQLALVDPRRAHAMANRLIADDNDPWALSVAHHARAMVLRADGLLDQAAVDFRQARQLARRAGDSDREADVQASYGLHLAMAGRPLAALEQLQAAVTAASDPEVLAKVRM